MRFGNNNPIKLGSLQILPVSQALMTISVLVATALVAAAQQPFNVVGEGLLTKPYSINGQPGKVVRYAGPVVYTNEKPPMIFFPPPPKDAKVNVFRNVN